MVNPHFSHPRRRHGDEFGAKAGSLRRPMLAHRPSRITHPGAKFVPPQGVALRRTTAGVAPFGKAASLAGLSALPTSAKESRATHAGARLDGSPPRNAMPTTGV